MSLSGALYEELVGDAGVSAIVGTRVYYEAADQDPTLPYIAYSQIGSEHVDHLTSPAGLARTVFQVDCFESNPHDADTLAAAVRSLLHHFSGTLGTGVATAEVRNIVVDGDRNTYEPPNDEEEFGTFGRSFDFGIWHTE